MMPYKNHNKHLKHGREYYLLHKAESRQRGRKYVSNIQVERKVILSRLKINGCAIRGYDKCTQALDFHHVNPEDKKFLINMRNLARYDDKIAKELNKCILLCANCHREIHFCI